MKTADDMVGYLTEAKLGVLLEDSFKASFIHNKCFIGKTRPDYRNDELKLIVEFDGWQHYTKASQVLADQEKDKAEMSLGYNVIRWPWFVQWSSETVKHFLGIDVIVKQVYPHGFNDKTCVLPADFCELGIKKFKKDLASLDGNVKDCIVSSLIAKAETAKHGIAEVLPPQLASLVDEKLHMHSIKAYYAQDSLECFSVAGLKPI